MDKHMCTQYSHYMVISLHDIIIIIYVHKLTYLLKYLQIMIIRLYKKFTYHNCSKLCNYIAT